MRDKALTRRDVLLRAVWRIVIGWEYTVVPCFFMLGSIRAVSHDQLVTEFSSKISPSRVISDFLYFSIAVKVVLLSIFYSLKMLVTFEFY